MKKLIILIPIFLLSATFLTAQTEVMPSKGDGTAVNPYQIETLGNLFWMANQPARWDKHYIQTANIDAQPTGQWFENQGWPRVGNPTDKFTGSYDGQNYSVSNLTVSVSNLSNQGFFGTVQNAVLQNIRLVNITVSGGAKSGGLAGEALGSTIENVSVSGTIISAQSYIGGVIGSLSGGQVQLAEAAVTVNGSTRVGGIAGYMTNHAELRHSFSTGSVSGNNSVGGLVGQCYGGWQIISDCYSHAVVTGEKEVGGLVGYLWAGAIYRSFSTGEVTGTSESNIGGLTGAGAGSNVRNSYWDKQTSGQEVSSGGTGLTTTEMKQKNSFRNFNFNVLWKIQEGSGYPAFIDLSGYKKPAEITLAELSGSGTETSPYIVTNLDELNAMRQNLAAHYRLGAGIDMAHCVIWDMGRGWTPVGTNTTGERFTGSLDGAGFTISNLTINRPSTHYQGLFGTIEGANMKNLKISNMNIQSAAYSGGLSGSMVNSFAEKINVSGTVISGGSYVGGLTGTVSGGVIHRASSDATVEGSNITGTLTGYMSNHAELRHSFSTGSVSGNNSVGGLVGQCYGGWQIISDCYSHAAVTGGKEVGGLVGYLWAGAIYRSFSTGEVTGTSESNIGGLTGAGAGSNVRNSYWDKQTSGQEVSSGGTGLTTAGMKQKDSFRDFNFNVLWKIQEGSGYPAFIDLSGYKMPAEITLADLSGSGTEASPYIIRNLDGLNAMRQNLAAHYRLGANIDMGHCVIWDMGRGWTPVGTNTTGERFTGSLDGSGFTLSNLTINRPATHYQGLFGTIEGTNMENLEISNMNIQSGAYSGGLSGSMVNSFAEKINVSGTVISGGSYVGGLTGTVSGGAIVYSSADVSVEGTTIIGGLSGYLTNHAEVRQSWSLGRVKGTLYVGGLIGQTYGGAQRISDSFSRAFVNGTSRVGGLAGFIWAGSVERCYSTGFVTGEEHVGGLTGQGSNISNSFWDTQTSEQNSGSGGTGKSTAAMKMQSTFTDAGWNFSSVWGINAAINDGYPYLREPVAVSAEENLFSTSGISVFPNPFLETFIIDLGKHHASIVLHISDVSGRTILTKSYKAINRIEGTLSGFPTGIYFLSILSDEDRTVKKLIKK